MCLHVQIKKAAWVESRLMGTYQKVVRKVIDTYLNTILSNVLPKMLIIFLITNILNRDPGL